MSVYDFTIRLGGLMFKKILSQQPITGLITLEEVKAHCRVFNNFEDTYLTSLIPVYIDMAQSYTGRMMTTGSAVVVVEDGCPDVLLPYGEVTAVTAVTLDGVASTDFTFDKVTQKVTINQPYGRARIEFVAGYATLPVTVKQAVLVMISTAYNVREDIVVGQTPNEMPRTSRDLLDRVKLAWQ